MSSATKPLFDEEPMATDLQPYAPPNPLAILEAAIERGIGPDELGKLMDLCERHERNQAAAAFGAAVAKFQRLCPAVHKGRTASIHSDKGNYKYGYAGFDDVMKQAGPHLAECGIAVSFSTEANQYGIRVTTRLRAGIHAEDYTLDVPIPQMKVNDTQKYGAALSYAKRYGLCAALNIVVTDDVDNDANFPIDTITEEQAIQIQEWIDSKNVNPQRFLEWVSQARGVKVERVADMPATMYQQAIDFLKRK